MFRRAIAKASKFTIPIILSTRRFDGSVSNAVGTMTILNDEGWFVTAAHALQHAVQARADGARIQAHLAGGAGAPAADPQWITHHSIWWGADGIGVSALNYHMEVDLAVGKLAGWTPSGDMEYPVLKDPTDVDAPGTSLCRLGFPFTGLEATFEERTSTFRYAPHNFPLPRFPLDGIFTRTVNAGRTSDDRFDVRFLETSTPGLRGQSGGPIFDVDGRVWGIQSRTMHYPLGFSPKATVEGVPVTEHQFMSVGWAVHPSTLHAFLRAHGVRVEIG